MFASKRSNIGKRSVSDQHGSVLGPRWHGMVSPDAYSSLQAWYDVSDASSMVIDGSNRVSLLSDKSGNSTVNCLVLPGVAGNYASSPDSAAVSITGDITIDVDMRLPDWTPASSVCPVSRLPTGSNASYDLFVNPSALVLRWSPIGNSASLVSATSTAAPAFSDFARGWIRATLDVDNGTGGWTARFFTSTDGVAWSQLGADITSAGTTSIFDGNAALVIGGSNVASANVVGGNIFRVRLYDSYQGSGTAIFDANFATAPKLATSFTESSSNAATVTINSTAIFNAARISGERDLYCGLTAGQPVYSLANRNITFDGSDDGLRTPGFILSQPITAFLVGSQVSWSSGDYILDGRSSTNTMALTQTTSSPRISMSAGSLVAENSDWALGTTALVQAQFNGASSSIRIGRGTATTGSAGTGAPNGITLGSLGGTANFGNFTMNELIVFSVAADASLQNRVALYANRKWGTSI